MPNLFDILCEDEPDEPDPYEGIKGPYCSATGMHVHTCRKCKSTWEHPEPPKSIDPDKAHACPKCGEHEYWKTPLRLVKKVDFPWLGEWPEEMKENGDGE